MLQELKVRGVEWIDSVGLTKAEVLDVLKWYSFHELDIEACLEEDQHARVDQYEDYLFMVLHFPKYNEATQVYELNEFNIFLGKNFLISLRDFEWTKISSIFSKYEKLDLEDQSAFKITSGFILYEVIQSMLEKIFKMTNNIRKDVKLLEKRVFDNPNSKLVKQIMIKKRNIVVLKHMLLPQIAVMKQIEESMNNMFKNEMEEYFEDLEDKIEKLVRDVKILEEYTDSLEDAFKTLIDIKTNTIITFLTFFSAFFLPLTLVTSFYGMNIPLPYEDEPYVIHWLLLWTLWSMFIAYYILRKRGKF